MKHVVRVFAHWALMVHIYVSMAGFTLALLFGATGLTLNHQDFGLSEPQIKRSDLTLDKALVTYPDQAEIERYLRKELAIRSPATDYREDPGQIEITFAVPGARTVVTVDRANASAEVEQETRGLLGKLDDLHKGFDAGPAWFWTIDVAAGALVISSMTGMVTLVALRARRRSGFGLCLAGILTVVLVYAIWVPK
jgi:hypothetical protein